MFADVRMTYVDYANGRVVIVDFNGVVLRSDYYGPATLRISNDSAEKVVHLTVSAEKDKVCTIQTTSDWQTWSELYRYTNSNEILEFDDLKATNSSLFYRLITQGQ